MQNDNMKVMPLVLDDANQMSFLCGKCSRPIILVSRINHLIIYSSNTYYFAANIASFQAQSLCIDQHSPYISTQEPFRLMNLSKVNCNNCKFQVGWIFHSVNLPPLKGLKGKVVFDYKSLGQQFEGVKQLIMTQALQQNSIIYDKNSQLNYPKQDQGKRSKQLKQRKDNMNLFVRILSDHMHRSDKIRYLQDYFQKQIDSFHQKS